MKLLLAKIVEDSPDPIRLGGIANKLAYGFRASNKGSWNKKHSFGHIQRGGNTSTFYDRILSTRYGVAAVEMINAGLFWNMALKGDKISYESLENVIKAIRM